MTDQIHDFISGFFLWRDAVIASLCVALLCGYLGVYVVLKRIVFVSAVLPQVSGLGIAVSFYVGSFIGEHAHSQYLFVNPWFVAIAFSCFVAALLSFNIDPRKVTGETLLGLAYIICSALVLEVLNSPRIVQEAHEIGDILFGNAVVVELATLYIISAVAAVVLLLHWVFAKEFLAVLFDSEMAATLGLRVRLINLGFYLSVALAVSVATRTIGALPVFGFMVVPPTAALMVARTLRQTFLLSIFIGLFSAFIGYFFSYIWSLPTGATMVVVSSLWLIPGLIIRGK